MILIYLITALLLATATFAARRGWVDTTTSLLYIALNGGLLGYAIWHVGERDSLYFQFDHLALILHSMTVLVMVPVFYHSYFYLKRRKETPFRRSLYLFTLQLLLTSMTATYFAANIGLSWAFTEGTTLFLALLIYHERHQLALEATWKYIFISSIGIALAFIGILFLSIGISQGGVTNLDIDNLIQHADQLNPVWLKIAFALLLVGYSGKLGVFPFHTITIDALAVAPSPITALVGSSLKAVGLVNIFRIYSVMAHSSSHAWASHLLLITGAVSVAIAALEMSKVRFFPRLLGYSSVEHIGFLLIALGLGGEGYRIAVLHLILHSFAKAGFFLQMGQVHDIYLSNRIIKCGHYFKVYPFGAITIIFAFLTISALPPSGLFVTEYLAFQVLFEQQHYFLAIFLMVSLVLILFFFTKDMFYLLFYQHEINKPVPGVVIYRSETLSQWLLFGLVIYLGFFPPSFLLEWLELSVAVLK